MLADCFVEAIDDFLFCRLFVFETLGSLSVQALFSHERIEVSIVESSNELTRLLKPWVVTNSHFVDY